jgi:heptosyltransferase-3
MATLQKINQVRRKLMQNITRNIGRSHAKHGIVLTDSREIKRILICRPNDRLGNLLLITPLLHEINSAFPDCTVDLFVRGGAAPIVFQNYDFVDRIIMLPKRPFSHLLDYVSGWFSIRQKKYDLVINVEKNSSSGRLSTMFARSRYKFFGEVTDDLSQHYPDYRHIAKYPVYNLRHYLTTLGFRRNNQPILPLDLKLSGVEKTEGAAILQKLADNNQKTICLFTFATGSKCYPESWWADCYNTLKAAYPNYNIVEILPVQNVSQIGYRAPSFYSKDVREIGAVIANADVFIGADSGIMHLAVSAGAPTIGLFWVTDINKYAPYGNGSFGINTNETPFEEWIPAVGDLVKKVHRQSKSA